MEYILYRNFSRHIFTLIILLFDQKLSIKLHLLCDFNIKIVEKKEKIDRIDEQI